MHSSILMALGLLREMHCCNGGITDANCVPMRLRARFLPLCHRQASVYGWPIVH